MPSLRLVSFLLAAGALAGCGTGAVSATNADTGKPATPVAAPGDTTATTDATFDGTPWIPDQARKAHGLLARTPPRHRRALPR